MKKLLMIVPVCTLLYPSLIGGEDPREESVRAHCWRKLCLAQSTVIDSIEVLGEDYSLKDNERLRVMQVKDYLDKDERIHRMLEFKNAGMHSVKLFFLNDLLVMIEFSLRGDERFKPITLEQLYELPFRTVFGSLSKGVNRRGFGRDGEGIEYAKQFPGQYHLVGMGEDSFIVAEINNRTASNFLKGMAGLEDTGGSLPGNVERIQLISRSLESSKAADLLQ